MPGFFRLLRAADLVCVRTDLLAGGGTRKECTGAYSTSPPAALPMVAALCGFPARPRLRPHAGAAPRRRYERHRPEKTPLHKIISEHLASWLEWRDEAERPVSGYVEEELRGYLECGILCFSLRPCPLHGLRPGVCDRVLVQGARGLPGPAEPGSAAMGTLGVPIGCQALPQA